MYVSAGVLVTMCPDLHLNKELLDVFGCDDWQNQPHQLMDFLRSAEIAFRR